MLAAYPDARLIQTHRDPVRTASSLSSLITTLRAMGSDDVDPAGIAKQWMRWNAAGVNASARARQKGIIAPGQVIDVSFYEFMDAPLEQMQRIYDFFELELSPSVRAAMQDYLSTHTAEQHGVHRYDFHDFGLDLAEERERVRPYQDYFDVRSEIQ